MSIKLVMIFALWVQITRQEGCNFTLFRPWDPVVFSSETLDFLYPSIENSPDNRNITLPVGATIIISCNGGHFSGSFETTKTIAATCNRDFQFEAEDAIVDFEKLDCINHEPQIARVTNVSCAPNAVIIEVGFRIGLNIKFLPMVKFCFDLERLTTLYTNYNITKSIGFIKSYLSTIYIIDDVFNNISFDFETFYNNITHQIEVINGLLDLPLNSTQFVDPVSCHATPQISTPGYCFSKRPLTYRGDFVYIPQQKATYRYINVVPQWSFLDYNLDKLERNVIDYVKNNKFDLEVYSGTYGVATLPHATNGEKVELFLSVDGDNKAIPVPLIFWKLIYDAITERATVFLTVNDPYQTDVGKNVICNDISDEITWLTWEKHNVTKGYSYACTYENAKAAISYLPDIEVKDILL